MSLVVPAVLPTSRKDLAEKLALFASIPGVSRVQIDVVDSDFATPASWPYNAPGELETMAECGEKLPHLDAFEYELDLMTSEPEAAARLWYALGAKRFIFHPRPTTDLVACIDALRHVSGDVHLGLALEIGTVLTNLEPALSRVDYVQCMGIATIGHQGEPFDVRVFDLLRALHAERPHLPLQVDGGVTLEHAKELVALGVSNIVEGSAIVRASDPAHSFAEFEALKTP